jgi:hypothetical protein
VILAGIGLNHGPADLALLGAVALVSSAIGLFLLADLRSTPSGFPWPEGQRHEQEDAQDHRGTGRAAASLTPPAPTAARPRGAASGRRRLAGGPSGTPRNGADC